HDAPRNGDPACVDDVAHKGLLVPFTRDKDRARYLLRVSGLDLTKEVAGHNRVRCPYGSHGDRKAVGHLNVIAFQKDRSPRVFLRQDHTHAKQRRFHEIALCTQQSGNQRQRIVPQGQVRHSTRAQHFRSQTYFRKTVVGCHGLVVRLRRQLRSRDCLRIPRRCLRRAFGSCCIYLHLCRRIWLRRCRVGLSSTRTRLRRSSRSGRTRWSSRRSGTRRRCSLYWIVGGGWRVLRRCVLRDNILVRIAPQGIEVLRQHILVVVGKELCGRHISALQACLSSRERTDDRARVVDCIRQQHTLHHRAQGHG